MEDQTYRKEQFRLRWKKYPAPIFQWDPATNDYAVMVHMAIPNGINPVGGLTYSEGKFYGATSGGGNNNSGVIFEWDPVSKVYLKKLDLTASTGTFPSGRFTVVGEPLRNEIRIVSPLSDLPLYAGTSFNMNFTATGSFAAGNIFSAELSDASGSFSSPVFIGTSTENSSASIAATIPDQIAPGGAYRIRIASSDPAVISVDNGEDLVIKSDLSVSEMNADSPMAYPNPFIDALSIQYRSPLNGIIKIHLLDVTGRTLFSVVQNEISFALFVDRYFRY